ncbi:MAG: hypothetical protein ACXWDI_09070, partial [Nocardioides sp.]
LCLDDDGGGHAGGDEQGGERASDAVHGGSPPGLVPGVVAVVRAQSNPVKSVLVVKSAGVS